jgi:alpha-mannosidase
MPAVITSLRALFTKVNAGSARNLQTDKPLFSIDSDQAIITSIKQSEYGSSVILRIVELHGKTVDVKLTSALPVAKAVEVTMLEKAVGEIPTAGSSLTVSLKPYEIKSLSIDLNLKANQLAAK